MDPAPLADVEHATFLLVEDGLALRSTLVLNLQREGYRVLTADTGLVARDVVSEQGASLDLIILDEMPAEESGLQMLRALWSHLDVPVLIISVESERQDKVNGLERGGVNYVTKPFELRELLVRIRAAVRIGSLPAACPSRGVQRGPLQIWPDRRCAAVDGRELRLRPKEFGLLLTLAREPGRLFGRQELLCLIWGKDVAVEERTVDVHISWLRGKLQSAGLSGDCIRTVYGAGYQFVQDQEVALAHLQTAEVADCPGQNCVPDHVNSRNS